MDLYSSHDLKIENKKILLSEFLSMLRNFYQTEKKLAVFCYYLLMQKIKETLSLSVTIRKGR